MTSLSSQLSIFDTIYPKYKIDKPIRLIEFFAGYGSQALALKYLKVPFEHWKICEWAVKSIQAYKDIHFTNENTDYSKKYSKDELVSELYNLGISANYNEPMTLEQINRLNENNLRTIYNNIITTHNLVNIQQAKGSDLQIVDTDKYCYLLTYSFPCQDLSLAGKGKGMSDISTRSGMLWEVERILDECNQLGSLPQILLMENVPQVHGFNNVEDFNKWQLKLESLGYKNYWEDLIATDYGIPQTRNRCFMVSILGEFSFSFPPKQPLKLKLKDLLEEKVEHKYFLSEKMIAAFTYSEQQQKEEGNVVIGNIEQWHQRGIVYSDEYAAPTICATDYKTPKLVGLNSIKIKKANSKGYLEATEGDGVDISSRMQYHRGCVQKNKAQTITTYGGENVGVVTNDLKIRKLTPKECFRLMGVKDEDFEKCAKNQSNASLYHLAGDSIVVNVIQAIIKELL